MKELGPLQRKQTTEEKPKKTIKLWDKRMQALKDSGTLPRDVFGQDPLYWDAPDETKKHCHFHWANVNIMRDKPLIPGYNIDMYQPVDSEIAEQLSLKVKTKTMTPEGYYKVGDDLILTWCPKEAWEEQMSLMRGPTLKERMEAQRAAVQEAAKSGGRGDVQTHGIGDVHLIDNLEEMEAVADSERIPSDEIL